METETVPLYQCHGCKRPACVESRSTFCEDCRSRIGLFRPSRLGLWVLCPGAYRLVRWLGQSDAEEPSAVAEEGTGLHRAMGDADAYRRLSIEDQGLVGSVLDFLRGFLGLDGSLEEIRSQIVWERPVVLRNGFGEVITGGSIDAAAISRGGIVEVKFGRLPPHEVAQALQATTYGAGVAQEIGDQVRTAVYHARSGAVFERTVTPEQAAEQATVIQRLKEQMASSDMDLRPSPAVCQGLYCPAKGRCPALHAGAVELATESIGVVAAQLSDTQLEDYLEKAKVVEGLQEELLKEARRRIFAGGTLRNYVLKEREGNRVVDDVQALYERVSSWVGQREFLGACRVSIRELEEMVLPAMKKELKQPMTRCKPILEKHLEGVVRRDKPVRYLQYKQSRRIRG